MEMNTITTELPLTKLCSERESVQTLMQNHRMRVALMGYRIFCDAYYETVTLKMLSRIGLNESQS
ncbi:MAG: hypothetical protein K2X01_05130 [Cyanobacteria bacterium]|nr:hypothetical protein [Cyanobacteriota bacterium]